MSRLSLELGNDSYDIIIERGVIARAAEHLNLDRKVLIVTDSGVPAEYAAQVAKAAKEGYICTILQGESSKNMDTFRDILKELLLHSFTRKDCVVAVGGGVVGDLSGFAAACYMRGIDFYNIPTTLLSQVDSSIGGKTAIDFEGVKNIVGAFYQPKKVLIDPDTLKTLDRRQFNAGLAEAIKMAATCDEELFRFIADSSDPDEDIQKIIEGALIIKKNVVEQDPKETSLRKVLNFGHTVGHAIESFYAGRYLHGECVAMGMIPMSSQEAADEIRRVLERYDLPVECDASADDLMPYLVHDKKSTGSTISTVYVPGIGSFEFRGLEPDEIRGLIS